MIYTTYDLTTGQILATIYDQSENTIPDNSIKGVYNDREHYIDVNTKSIVDKPTKPSNIHKWDVASKTWIKDNDQAIKIAKNIRNGRLSLVDQVNPIWYASLTTEQQTELQAYRTALLNVPQQSGFPETIEWPNKPTWL